MEGARQISFFIGFGCLAMLVLASLVIIFFLNYRRKMLEKEKKIGQMDQEKQIEVFRASVEAEERQKERIANNLHDEIIPILTATMMNIEKHMIDYRNNRFAPEDLKRDLETIDQGINGIRDIAMDLIPKTLLYYGLLKAVYYYVKNLDGPTLSVDFENKTAFENEMPISKSSQMNIYRVCLEILNNLYKHARYRHLKVTFAAKDNNLLIEFMHDGKSVTNEEIARFSDSGKGLGLKSLQSRLLILNATINYGKVDDIAFINVGIPFDL